GTAGATPGFAFQAAVAFEDVAIYFSPEEWVELAAWQRELYQEVMMDNYDLVACLGKEEPCQGLGWPKTCVGSALGVSPTQALLIPHPSSSPKWSLRRSHVGGLPLVMGTEKLPTPLALVSGVGCSPPGAWGQRAGSWGRFHASWAQPRAVPWAPRHGMAGEDPPGDGDQGHWVPPVPPSGGAKELGCPPLCPGWCEAGTWGSPRRMGTWERGERLLEPAAPGGLLICGTCGENFEDAASLGAHQGEHLGPAPSHECTACGKVFQHHRNLLTHKKHRGRHRHACAECGCTFCLRGDLLRHRAVHAGEGSYPCALCSRRFRHKRDLQEHRREHAAAAPRQCPQCQKRFEDEASLSQHRASHVEERPFVCGRCGRSFSWKESLMIHQRSHAPERSHKCPVCGRSFSRSGNLLVHQRVHTGERPYACAQCDKAFCNKANLITHKKLHRRYKTFACAQCRLGFSSKSKLLLHLRAATGAWSLGGCSRAGKPPCLAGGA
uniref:Uncharacterized protein n=1 Tax=Anas platyrhynchos platyrhynchos TaxID=8840 RepID=A0A493T3M8_ANAPP